MNKNNGIQTKEQSMGYFNIPKTLINESRFERLSVEAIFLYGLMLDRLNLSMKNGWKDSKNRTYIIFTVEETQKFCKCSHAKAIKILKELEKTDLITRKRLGQGKPAITYINRDIWNSKQTKEKQPEVQKPEVQKPEVQKPEVQKPEVQKPEVSNVDYPQCYQQENDSYPHENANYQQSYPHEVQISDFCYYSDPKNPKNETSRSAKNELLEVSRIDGSNTDISNTDINNSIQVSYQSIKSEDDKEKITKIDIYRNIVCDNINYKYLTSQAGEKEIVDELVEIIVDVLSSSKERINVNKEERPMALVKGVFYKLKSKHIEYVLWCLRKNTSKIHNIYSYLITTLYNAHSTIGNWYLNKVNNEMPAYVCYN